MNRIDKLFSQKSHNILNIYVLAGFPQLQDTVEIVKTLETCGVDMIEIGMPYSDPMADGPTIQRSSSMALRNGMRLTLLFEQIKEIRKGSEIPLLMMGHLNQLMQFGINRFIEECQISGIDGLIIPDLPIDMYEEEIMADISSSGIHMVFLITPQTSEERIRKIDSLTGGFVYMVSNASITGAKQSISRAQEDYFERIGSLGLRHPRLIGFGISNYETLKIANKYANGVIIASAFIQALERDDQSLEQRVRGFIDSIKNPKYDHSA
jgi:tryptophan synthase alpha chain